MGEQKKWFFLKDNQVSGPYTKEEIEPLAATSAEGLIWGHGLSEWVTHTEWHKILLNLQDVLQALQTDMTPNWLLKHGDQVQGPFTYDGLVQALKNLPSPGESLIQQPPESKWKGIYDYPTLVEEVGITRRQHNRVPISGLFKYEKNGVVFDSLLASISQGGIGIIEAQGISIGDTVRGQIQSPQLASSFSCQCEVLYQQEDGHWGLRFLNLPMEFMTIIVEYTRKFKESSTAK